MSEIEVENSKIATSENEIPKSKNSGKKKKGTIKNLFKNFGSASNSEKTTSLSLSSLKNNKFLKIIVIVVLVALGVYVLYLKKMKKEKTGIDEKNPLKLLKKKVFPQSGQSVESKNKKSGKFIGEKKKNVHFRREEVNQEKPSRDNFEPLISSENEQESDDQEEQMENEIPLSTPIE